MTAATTVICNVPSRDRPARARSRRRLRRGLQAGAVALALALGGCSSSDYDDLDVFGVFAEDPPPPETEAAAEVRERGDAVREAAQDEQTPSLTTVPPRPDPGSATVRERVLEGLVADRENARYTDEAIRLQEQPPARPEMPAAGSTGREVPAPPPVPPADDVPPAYAPVDAEASASPPPSAPPPAYPSVREEASAPPPATATADAAGVSAPPPPPPPAPPAARAPTSAPPSPAPPSADSRADDTPRTGSAVTVDPGALDAAVPAPRFAGREEQVATIQFAHGSSSLDGRDRRVLAAVVSAQRRSGDTVLVVGHASMRTQQLDQRRHERVNREISMARANAVARALVEAGIDADKVRIEAASDDAPIYAEAMPTGEAGNRRADVYLIR